MARLLLGVSGGIAAYKALETARLAVLAGHSLRAILTPNSERFVGRASFEAITGAPALTGEFEPEAARGAYPGEPVPEQAPITHLALVQRAGAYLIAPASANTLAKLATGLADNLLSTAALAAAHHPYAYDPYLPVMTLFGLPRALAGAHVLTDPRIWFGA